MEIEKFLNHDPENIFSEERFLNRLFSRNLIEKEHNQDLTQLKFFTMMDYIIAEPSVEQLLEEIHNLQESKLKQSIDYNVHSDDTPSQIMLTFAQEFLYILKSQKMEGNHTYLSLSSKIDNNPDLEDALFQNNDNKLKDFFDKNPNFFESIDKKLHSFDPYAKIFLDKAWEKVFDENYEDAINLLNEGIDLKDKVYLPHLFECKSDCQLELNQSGEALMSIDEAIELLMQDPFDFDKNISLFLFSRSAIKEQLGDTVGSRLDQEVANKYKSLWNLNHPIDYSIHNK